MGEPHLTTSQITNHTLNIRWQTLVVHLLNIIRQNMERKFKKSFWLACKNDKIIVATTIGVSNSRFHEKKNGTAAQHWRFFARNSNSMERSPYHNSVVGHQIATNFCTCHDNTAAVPCTKFCSDRCIIIELRVKRNFQRIWIAVENPLVKRAPQLTVFILKIARISRHHKTPCKNLK